LPPLQEIFGSKVLSASAVDLITAIGFPDLIDRKMSEAPRHVQPASLKWQADGELSTHDVFHLLCRLRQVEAGATINELWHLTGKYPNAQR
jgi:hypothetical protein